MHEKSIFLAYDTFQFSKQIKMAHFNFTHTEWGERVSSVLDWQCGRKKKVGQADIHYGQQLPPIWPHSRESEQLLQFKTAAASLKGEHYCRSFLPSGCTAALNRTQLLQHCHHSQSEINSYLIMSVTNVKVILCFSFLLLFVLFCF